jgi:hypothetical protein
MQRLEDVLPLAQLLSVNPVPTRPAKCRPPNSGTPSVSAPMPLLPAARNKGGCTAAGIWAIPRHSTDSSTGSSSFERKRAGQVRSRSRRCRSMRTSPTASSVSRTAASPTSWWGFRLPYIIGPDPEPLENKIRAIEKDGEKVISSCSAPRRRSGDEQREAWPMTSGFWGLPLLTSRIGNSYLRGLKSGFPAITQRRLDHDYECRPSWKPTDIRKHHVRHRTDWYHSAGS